MQLPISFGSTPAAAASGANCSLTRSRIDRR